GLGALFEHPTVEGMAQLLARDREGDDGLGPVVTLSNGDAAHAPLFFFHPAGGLCWGYRGLAHALEPRRKVYGLQSPALDLSQPLPQSIAALSGGYAAAIVALHDGRPIHLAGWSVGGIIAQDVAVHLRAKGYRVGLVALLDAYPSECWRAEPEPD